MLVNTDPAMDNLPHASAEKTARKNKFECWIVLHLVHELVAQGLDPTGIAVVTPYIQQSMALKEIFDPKHVDVFTLEKCVGTVKDCVIISCVKQNDRMDLVKEVSRIHIAFPRARAKLVIVGSRYNLKHIASLRDYFVTMKKKNMGVNVNDIVAEKEYCSQHYTSKELKPLF